jgi:hypothetical protein
MKYVITESKLERVIFKYLDMKLDGIEKRKGIFIDTVFGFPNEKYGVLGWEESGILEINYELINEIENLFGYELPETLNIIVRYVEDRYNLEVKDTDIVLEIE